MNVSLVLLAHPRSGSTAIRDIFDLHPRLSVLNEPFNPTRGSDGWGYDFLADLNAGQQLPDILQDLKETSNGVKHLLGQLTLKQDLEVFAFFPTKFFMVRRNQLQAVASSLIAEQTLQWHRRGAPRMQDQPLEPLDLNRIAEYLDTQGTAIAQTNAFLAQHETGHQCRRIVYEDLFGENVSISQRLEITLELVRSVVGNDLSNAYIEKVAAKLDHDSNKVNSTETYRLLPNLAEINRLFGAGQFGAPLE
ncbi:hypothetical protein Pla22_29740 [Rubripirellula amarantea]|uniref:Stf0 sulfotransferase n=1 Tax=Rubripirellula amarantea TaxID=2527999 RepID=A0A5C5WJU0_9BACT|nr:hypothetical protein [Rubripirellula amarantea]TWT50233.1 hypothetical protein Pla22_29740 [Rubripirellula amarantea]